MLQPENVGINWRLDTHGTQRIEVLVKARNKFDQYARYRDHLGQRLALYDSTCYRPISGYITDVEYAGAGRVLYTAKGPGACRLEDELDTNVYTVGNRLDVIIEFVLTNYVSVASSDYSNIDNNSTLAGGWQPTLPQGSYPKDVIAQMLNMSDSSGNIWDFWFKDQPFAGVTLQNYLPYYKARSTTAAADWVVYSRDLSRMTVARDINDIVTDASVYYGTITGTHDGGNNASQLVDSTKNFRQFGVLPGDRVTNITDGSRGRVIGLNDTTTTNLRIESLSGGTDNDFDTGDAYAIQSQDYLGVETDSATATYWDRAAAVFERGMDDTQAAQYAGVLANTEPRQVQSFTVGAPSIRTGGGARVPLWRVVSEGGGYIRWADMYPAAALFSTSANALTTFRITGLDYDYSRNQLSVTLDQPSRRLDARLRRAGILGSDMIQRG